MATYKHTGVGNASARDQYAAMGQVQDGAGIWCGTAGGTADAITLTPSPAITAYAAGQRFDFKSGASANTGAVTFAISGLSAIAGQVNGAACVGGEIAANQWYRITLSDASTAQIERIGEGISGPAIGSGKVPQWNGSAWVGVTPGNGTVTSITAGTGLTGGTITTSGTIAVDVGTSANKIVQLDGSAKLPAVDGSQLTNLPATGGTNYFGSGADGALSTSGNVTHTSTVDGDAVVKNYTSLTINSGHTMTVSNRCKGLFIYVDGNCTIDGTLTMTARGASASGAVASVAKLSAYPSSVWASEVSNQIGGSSTTFAVPAAGASGGAAVVATTSNAAGVAGSAGTNGQSGGGGSGAVNYGTSGAGAAGTSYSGGSGGGGNAQGTRYDAAANGGAGGNGGSLGANYAGGGGAGNPGGTGVNGGSNGTDGTGGLLILIVKGNLTIGASGAISANGSAGGNANGSAVAVGGGGSGGGSIIVLYGGTLSNSGSIQANGGAGGAASGGGVIQNGGAGGAGSIQGPTQISGV